MTLRSFTIRQFGERRWQKRVQLSVDKLLAVELINEQYSRTKSGIQKAFEYWRDKKQRGRLTLEGYEWGPGDDVVTTLIDVSPSSPFHYRFMSHNLKYFRWMTDRRLTDFPHREIVDACALEYHACKAAAEPAAHHISHDLNGFRRDYLRLLLPLTDRWGRVSALACVSQHLDSPVPAGSPPSTPAGSTTRAGRRPPAASRASRLL
jgi:hypothetical protein